jgi:hypothetical protein
MSLVKSLLKATGAYNYAISYLHRIAIRYYKKKIKEDAVLKATIEELNRMGTLRTHYGHKELKDENIILDLSILLAEIINTLKERLQTDPLYEGAAKASFLDAGDSDRIVLRSIGCTNGMSLNISDFCVNQIRSVGGVAVKGDVQAMPFEDNRFDYVFCFETLEHLESPIQGLKELARVCSGKVFITVPWVGKTRIHGSHNEPVGENHIFEFNQKDFARAVTHTDLRITYYKEIKIFPKIYNPIDNFVLRKFYYPSFFPKFQFYELTKEGANA